LNCSRYAIALVTSAFIINPAHQISKFFATRRLHLVVLQFVSVSGEPERRHQGCGDSHNTYTTYLLNYRCHNNTIVYKIYIINYQYIMLLNCYNLEYILFLKIKKFIHRIKLIFHKKPLSGLFEHLCFIHYNLYRSWQMIEGPNSCIIYSFLVFCVQCLCLSFSQISHLLFHLIIALFLDHYLTRAFTHYL
jgi:hypothetical protein